MATKADNAGDKKKTTAKKKNAVATSARPTVESHCLPFLDHIVDWVQQGATNKEVAARLDISYSTLRDWIKKGQEGEERFAAFAEAFIRARDVCTDTVEAALYKKTQGYNAKVAKTFKLKRVEYDPDTGKKISEKEVLQVGYEEVHVPADTYAQIFWLTNNRKERWQHKPTQESGDNSEEGKGVVMLPEVSAASVEKGEPNA